MTRPPTPGEVRFARYALTPNDLGYCGPLTSVIREIATDRALAGGWRKTTVGAGTVPKILTAFSGAGLYHRILAELLDTDCLSEDVVQAYWLGVGIDAVDAAKFSQRLLHEVQTIAGHYWAHLDESLAQEVRPTHAFHVYGIYPWSRLLSTGRPEPVQVLNSCRLRVGRVLSVNGDSLMVSTDTLIYEGDAAHLEARTPRLLTREETLQVTTRLRGIDPGAIVAVHWGEACDVLTEDQARAVRTADAVQRELTSARLGAAKASS
ncbi:DUF6390 family protein [Devriesea agamarum]|uniref:DUF6390 family protein n=1 Tax=Devriesea agamarum TaxID=472569 RepID=UPI00071C22A6|nr:DUF6390 family protein [Devriesea agamarum]